jgi:hypothetical protein
MGNLEEPHFKARAYLLEIDLLQGLELGLRVEGSGLKM